MEKIRQSYQRLRGRYYQKGLILMYHRVANLESDPLSLCVSHSNFIEQLDFLTKFCHPISLRQLVKSLEKKDIPFRAIAVTFDDGYADNLFNAKPLLEEFEIPATVFLTTGYIGQNHEFWWDKLDRLFLQPGRLPEILCIKINGINYRWDLGDSAHYSKDNYKLNLSWKPWQDVPSSRHFIFLKLCELLKPLLATDRQNIIEELTFWASAGTECRPTHRPMTKEEVAMLAQGELIEVGSHTITHPILSALPVSLQQYEIEHSKTYLEEILDREVASFAYPYGNQSDYTEDTIAIIQKAGFSCACSVLNGIVTYNTEPYKLPRVYIGDWNGDEFARNISEWFND